MKQERNAFLFVEKGEPDELGKTLSLRFDSMLIGRPWGDHKPDISFDNPYVSKKHAEISYDGSRFILTDLPSSKHGTEIDGKLMNKGMPYILKHDDIISLAKGNVVLRFRVIPISGDTLDDIVEEITPLEEAVPFRQPIVVDDTRKDVLLDGQKVAPRIAGKEYKLIQLLYQNQGRAVSNDMIKSWVWSERDSATDSTIPLVGADEVTQLVHRLKKRLDAFSEELAYSQYIVNVHLYGYMLDQKS